MESLFNQLEKTFLLSASCREYLRRSLERDQYKAGDMVFHPCGSSLDMAFVESGFMHTYVPGQTGSSTTRFHVTGDLYISPQFSLQGKTVREYTQALDDTVLYWLTPQVIERASKYYGEFADMLSSMEHKNHLRNDVLSKLHLFTPDERIEWLNTHFIHAAPVHRQKIGWYVGITPAVVRAFNKRARRRSEIITDK